MVNMVYDTKYLSKLQFVKIYSSDNIHLESNQSPHHILLFFEELWFSFFKTTKLWVSNEISISNGFADTITIPATDFIILAKKTGFFRFFLLQKLIYKNYSCELQPMNYFIHDGNGSFALLTYLTVHEKSLFCYLLI